jgi:hypothetical protein
MSAIKLASVPTAADKAPTEQQKDHDPDRDQAQASVSARIRARLQQGGVRFHANDNISR